MSDIIKKTIYIDREIDKQIKILSILEETTESKIYNELLQKAIKKEISNEKELIVPFKKLEKKE